MKTSLLTILLSFNLNYLSGQIFLDSKFYQVDKGLAKYYQLIDTANEFIEIRTFLMNDTLFEVQHLTSLNPRIIEGKNLKYYESGKLKYDLDYKNNMLNGNVIGYYENGQIKRVDIYKNDTLITGKCYTKEGKDTSHYLYIKSPSFNKGGIQDFRKYVAQHLKYPPISAENGVQGQVIVQFTINSNGKAGDVVIVSSPDAALGKEAQKVVSSSPKWEPGIFEGKPGKFSFTIPVIFVLQ